jgi:drug/metabolite transporter (DMT)-like permease
MSTRSSTTAEERLALLAMAGINLIWGAGFPVMKVALATIPPFSFALFRFAIALAVLLVLAWRPALAILRGPDRWRFVVLGSLGFCLCQVGQNLALALSPAADIALLATSSPLWVALLAWPWLGERPTGRVMAGLTLALAGIVLVVWPAESALGPDGSRLTGALALLLAMLAWAGYVVLGKDLMARHAALPATTTAALVGTAGLVPFAAGEWLAGLTPRLTLEGVAGVLFTSLLVTVVGFLVFFWALGRARVAPLAALTYLQPLVGVGLAWAVLGEPLSGAFVLGGALVLGGVWLATRPEV